MKYLIYFTPNNDLESLIRKEKGVKIPKAGIHCTIYLFNMNEENENVLIDKLLKIHFNPFNIKTIGFEEFNENSLVIKLSKTEELFNLHKDIVSLVDSLGNNNPKEIENNFRDNYTPHITISDTSYGFNKNSNSLIGIENTINSINLAKRQGSKWENIKIFNSKQ